jgi:cell division protein FtsQ
MDRPEGFSSTTSGRAKKPAARAQSALKQATQARVKAERDERRRLTAATRLRRRRWGISVASVGVLALTVVVLTLSPVLSLKKVVVEGAERLESSDIAGALDPLYGEPLARVSPDVVGNALAGITLIQAFDTRIEPPGTLVVTIQERKPIGVVVAGGAYSVVDAAAVDLWEEPTRPANLPRILVAADQDSPSFTAVSLVLLALPEQLLGQVEGITATTRDDVRFTIRGAAHEVVWGSSDRASEKARVLAAALRATTDEAAQIIDVTTPESVVIRAKG